MTDNEELRAKIAAALKAQIMRLEDSAEEIPHTVVAKFIVAGGKIYWGEVRKRHIVIAMRNSIPFDTITGGGLARPLDKIIRTSSSARFGPYSQEEVQRLLPDWEVEEPDP